MIWYSGHPQYRAVWSSHTTPVVLLSGTIIPSGKVYRAQIYPTTSPRYAGRLVMQRDGTLAVFSPGGTVLWRSTSYGTYSAVLLDCGRLEFLPRYGEPHEFPSWQVPASCNG
ncbi:MAG: hypothetical protein ABIP57_00060 [Jatrophihabitantaceae bacterium]